MVAKEELLEKFQIIGCENLDDDVLEKCIELCQRYDVDEEEFVNMWFAFGISHLDGNMEPSIKTLEEFKRSTPRTKSKDHNESFEKPQKQHKIVLSSSKSEAWMDDDNDILGMYASSDKLSFMRTKRPRSPDPEDSGSVGCKAAAAVTAAASQHQQHEVECTPPANLELSLSSTQSTQSNQSRSTGPKLLASAGPKLTSWTNDKPQKYTIRHAGPHVPANARYMFELLKTSSDVRTRMCRQIGYQINWLWAEQKKQGDDLKKQADDQKKQAEDQDQMLITWNVRTRHQKPYRTWGRVCFESETKQTNPTTMLEGCRKPPRVNNADTKLWPQVELDVSEIRECCLFPGQIIAVEGLNITENLMKVENIFTGSFIPAAKPPHLTDDLKVVIAAGPFTPSTDLSYQPLWELMTKVAEEEPHVLILIGPFLDHNHQKIQNDELNCTYQEYFNKLILKIKNHIDGKCTQVVLVASSRDVHHHAVYPTPEYFIPKSAQSPDIHVLPDPCTLDIDGLRLGITSIDCLMHLGREEVTLKPSGTDKLSRLGNYILNQACFYPLYPPAKEINIDSELWERYAFFKEKPHVLLLPSDMRYFCKYINESVILNPERLSKRTFAKMNFKPVASKGSWSQNNVSCEIIKM